MADDLNFDDVLPLTAVVFEILIALADSDRHGYGIILEVERRTDGGFRLRPGSLYRALNRMEEDGWVEEVHPEDPAESDDPRRRYYRLTAIGRRIAAAEAERLQGVLASARDKHLIGKAV